MLCRSEDKAKPVIEDIKKETKNDKIEFVKCDLSDWKSVVAAAKKITDLNIPIHVLLNNAGVMALPKYTECKQGLEMQLSSCHFGHFILTRDLYPAIKKAGAGARIVTLSSYGHIWATIPNGWFGSKPGFDFENVLKKEKYNPYWHYGHVLPHFNLY
jgi:WW domain-containing oxidoreductase